MWLGSYFLQFLSHSCPSFHKFWCFFMKFPWNSLFCWYLSLSLHIPTNKDGKFYGKIKFKTESFGDEDWGKYCCPCQGTCIHHNQILCIWPGFRNRQDIFHLQEQRGKDIHNHQKIIMANNVEVIIKSLYTWKSLSNQSSRRFWHLESCLDSSVWQAKERTWMHRSFGLSHGWQRCSSVDGHSRSCFRRISRRSRYE